MFDPRREVPLAFRGFPANVVPSTILLDRKGRVAAVYVATVPEEDLRTALDRLMAKGCGLGNLGATFAGIVTDGLLLLAVAMAALVGLISFASLCVLPARAWLSRLRRRPHRRLRRTAVLSPAHRPHPSTASAISTTTRPARSDRRRVLPGALLLVAASASSSSPSIG